MMSAVMKLVQGSPEWLHYRKTLRNASESATVMGLSPWMTPYQLWLVKTGRSTQEVTPAMAHGTALEPVARAAYEAQTGQVMQPLVLQEGLYSASLDGITLGGELILEVKCPFRGKASELWKTANAGQVPEHYRLQVQHQLMVSEAHTAHLWVYAEDEGLLLTIHRDELAMASIRKAWDGFQRYLDTDTPPPMGESDAVIRTDAEWTMAAQVYLEAKRQAETATVALEQARDRLVDLTHHVREQGAGVSVVRLFKAGNVDYKKVPELRGVDLDKYRARGREEVRVTVVK